MPILQNMALTVIDENTYNLKVNDTDLNLYTYYVKSLKEQEEKFVRFKENFCELLLSVLEGATENDILNGLLLTSGLEIRKINLFMLYRNYYWQIGAPYLPVNQSFLNNPEVINALSLYFTEKFDPSKNSEGPNPERLVEFEKRTKNAIEKVKTVAEDVIFKTIFNMMQATIRSNYFNIDEYSAGTTKINIF